MSAESLCSEYLGALSGTCQLTCPSGPVTSGCLTKDVFVVVVNGRLKKEMNKLCRML